MPTFFSIYMSDEIESWQALLSVWDAIEDGGYLIVMNTDNPHAYEYFPGQVSNLLLPVIGSMHGYSELSYIGSSLREAKAIVLRKKPALKPLVMSGTSDAVPAELAMAMVPPSGELDRKRIQDALKHMRYVRGEN